MDWFSADSPLIIAHRGASAEAPENTLAAFGLALEQGADGIELDVQLSADGRCVIMHDFKLDRVTNGQGKVSALTLAELQALEIHGGGRIPTLPELFETFGPQLLYNIELKDVGLRDRGLETAVADIISAHHLENACLISSFNPFSLRRMRKCLPNGVPLALLRAEGALRYTYLIADGQADHPHFSMVDDAYMVWAKKRGYYVNVWTVDEPEEAKRLAALGVNGLITNKPQFLRAALEK
jgi:glycerophosphoryl diester phosphodiesterase